jgi:hypothetical protein
MGPSPRISALAGLPSILSSSALSAQLRAHPTASAKEISSTVRSFRTMGRAPSSSSFPWPTTLTWVVYWA